MTKEFAFSSILALTLTASAFAQANEREPDPASSRVVVTSNLRPVPTATPRPVRTPAPIIVGSAGSETRSPAMPAPTGSNVNFDGLSFSQIKSRIAEAKRELISRPATIGSSEAAGSDPVYFVKIAYLDERTRQIEFVSLSKDAFLAKNVTSSAISTDGSTLFYRNIRANGVNTPVVLTDQAGRSKLPLLIQYPVVRNGRFIETAYYVSTHPGIITPDVISAGRFYVRNTIEVAREKLRRAGYSIQPKVADIAERLATVEHVDHWRFRNEPHANIFNDIFTLYALNEGQTYRYSVSSAGAGGMVQMIPSTYRMVRARFPQAGLMPDFVEGMQDHVNATKAMLLYMQMTWNDLASNETVAQAMADGIARQEDLMAAGYNSNPARLAGYIRRGGDNWTNLIPRETQIYLQIYASLERAVPLAARSH
ncbi:MAG: hypothetical protein UZ17_ACD001002434 [Acidobacteria bacterium OLB17]|nr:MAG: hypothetical protein UZ17_ACD001002434 [Acidobacteria bacterium OLB17]MCZ2389954.1 hypothetical protein [Acidobacteriota bacterium]